MTHGHTVESLIAFETRVADAFKAGRIRAPVHLCSDGQAQPLLDIFREVQPEDWVFSTWRSHWHCLLKGVPEEEVFDAILAGRSMYLQFPKYNVFSSAIVGGSLPIALGVAAGLKREMLEALDKAYSSGYAGDFYPEWDWPRVWVFVGDMACRTGLFHEFWQYASGHGLPVRIVIEDNGLSTDSDTIKTWGCKCDVWAWHKKLIAPIKYDYTRNYPHVGVGEHVQF